MNQSVRPISLTALCLLTQAAFSADFVIEEDGLVQAPKEVADAVMSQVEQPVVDDAGKQCALIGKRANLQGGELPQDWIVIPVPPCSWAAAAAPIWVLRSTGKSFQVVLAVPAYDLTVGKASARGMRHLATARATAGWGEEVLWKFDGQKYVQARRKSWGTE